MTTDVDARCLETFPNWLRTLGADCESIVAAVTVDGVGDTVRRALVGGLNYVFKSVDLIPDGIDDIGYLDDAFVLRVAAGHALRADAENRLPAEVHAPLAALAADADLVKAFLRDDYARLEHYVQGLRRGAARGRSVDDVVSNTAARAEFVNDVHGFAQSYHAPSFAREERNLIKLRAFFDAKLPR